MELLILTMEIPSLEKIYKIDKNQYWIMSILCNGEDDISIALVQYLFFYYYSAPYEWACEMTVWLRSEGQI